MASAKFKQAINHPNRKASKQKEPIDWVNESSDQRLGMERRKFSYTIHIPERRSGHNNLKSNNFFQNAKQAKPDPHNTSSE